MTATERSLHVSPVLSSASHCTSVAQPLTWKYAIKVNTISRLNPRSFKKQRQRISNRKKKTASLQAIRRDFSCSFVGGSGVVSLFGRRDAAHGIHSVSARFSQRTHLAGPLAGFISRILSVIITRTIKRNVIHYPSFSLLLSDNLSDDLF